MSERDPDFDPGERPLFEGEPTNAKDRKASSSEYIVRLENGRSIRTDSFQDNPAGASYVRICDEHGNEVAYWDHAEWAEDPQLVMGAILGSCESEDNIIERPEA